MAGHRELHGGLPDPGVPEPPGRDHELDGLRQVGHLLLHVHGAIGAHAEGRVAAHKDHLPVVQAALKLHCRNGSRGKRYEQGCECTTYTLRPEEIWMSDREVPPVHTSAEKP